MDSNVLKTNILSIVIMGFAISLSGIVFYFMKDQASQYIRYLLPIPPIGVAAYVYVVNMFEKYNGKLPGTLSGLFREVFFATLFSTVVFAGFTVFLILLVNAVKR